MDRHSSYIFIWLQLELCAMAVLLTKGEGPRWGPGGACGNRAGGSGVPGTAPERSRARRCLGTPLRAVLAAEPPRLWLPPLRPTLPPGRRCRAVTALQCPALSRPLGPGAAVWGCSGGALGTLRCAGALGALGAAVPGGSGVCGLWGL